MAGGRNLRVKCRSGQAGVERWQIMLSGRDRGERPESADNSVYPLFFTQRICSLLSFLVVSPAQVLRHG